MFPEAEPAAARVVLIDDEEMVRLAMEQALQLAGIAVEAFPAPRQRCRPSGAAFPASS